jgi:hypothetical protein
MGPGLYSVAVDGSTAAVQILAFEDSYLIHPASDRVIAGFTQGIYSVPIDGGPGTILLSGPYPYPYDRGVGHPFYGGREPVLLSPDASRVVFISDQGTDEVFELYSVPVDGGAPEVKLNGPLTASGDVYQFAISPDSSHVVYRADQMSNDVYELFSVPIQGGEALRINEPFVTGGDIGDQVDSSCFLISPDSSGVAYRADQNTDGIQELFSVPIDGGPALRLNPSFPGPNNDVSFGLLACRGQLVYSSDQEVNAREELFTVPIDGNGAARKLSGTMTTDGDVQTFPPAAISADGAFVVYMADQDTNGVNELFASRLFPVSRVGHVAVR